jgi:hypothetical protein
MPVSVAGGRTGKQDEEIKVQPKLTIGPVDDVYEQEADRVAEQVMRMPEPNIQLEAGCSSCVDLDEELIRTKPFGVQVTPLVQLQEELGVASEYPVQGKRLPTKSPPVTSGLQKQIQSLRGGGQPLPASTRAFFEPRLGYDFSQVGIHSDARAIESARSIKALAYTVGNDIVFASGRYEQATAKDRRLLAHELTHTVQQGRGDVPLIQRAMQPGSGASPVNWRRDDGTAFVLSVVPPGEQQRVNAAIGMVAEVAMSPNDYPACHELFQERCPNGQNNTFQTVYNAARVWKLTNPQGTELARGDVNGSNIAYTQSGYAQGTRGLAETLTHELMHNCGVPGGATHYNAEYVAQSCIGGARNRFAIQGAISGDTGMVLLTYRRIIAELGGGHFRATAGADWDYTGTILEILGEDDIPHEIASGMIGFQERVPVFGAERFGGLFGRVETGFGVGRFLLREPSEGEPSEITGSYILQITGGAEFLIPSNPSVFPLSIEAGYRLTQPLNSAARRIHSFVLTTTFSF